MAEESNVERESAPSPFSSDAAAWAALSAASREKADAFLDEQKKVALEQAALFRLQAKELEHELRIRHWSLRVRHLSDVLKLTFEVALAFIVVGAAVFLAAAVWDAADDHGVVVEAFEVPVDYANRGVTGEALAGDLLADLAKMQNGTNSARPAGTYKNNWDNDFKVQIADTGVSLGELNRTLHQWLGHETRISGELARTADGIEITARVGDTRATFEGKESERDQLLQKAAEAVYLQTQPYRYGVWLEPQTDRRAEAEAVFRKLTNDPSIEERTWADIGMMNVANLRGNFREGLVWIKAALALEPNHPLALFDFAHQYLNLGDEEDYLVSARKALPQFQSSHGEVTDRALQRMRIVEPLGVDAELGDFEEAAREARVTIALPDYRDQVEVADQALVNALAFQHDAKGFAELLNELPAATDATRYGRIETIGQARIILEDWRGGLAALRETEPLAARGGPYYEVDQSMQNWPYEAAAQAALGDAAGARALIAKTPLDCTWCVILRGRVDELDGNLGGAIFWYADAARLAPSLPFPSAYWGATLLREGRYGDAIAKFREANLKGPHFADPLEMWGEALMQENRSDLALAKFAEAAKYAPNWGRLHLEWGKALFYAGRNDDAKKEFAVAAHLDLSPADKASLAKMSGSQRGVVPRGTRV